MGKGGQARNIATAMMAGFFVCACSSGVNNVAEQAAARPLELRPHQEAASAFAYTGLAVASAFAASGTTAIPAGGEAANSSSILLEEVVHAALAFHPSIDEAVSRVRQGEAEIRVARAGYLPTIDGGLDTSFHGGDEEGWEPRLNVSGSQMLYDFGKVSSRVESRRAEDRINRAELLLGVDQLVRDTVIAAIEVQRYAELVKAAEAQVEGVGSISALVRQRTEQGASTQSDRVQAEARLAAAEAAMLELNGQFQRWRSALANLTGMPLHQGFAGLRPFRLDDACSAPDPDWSQTPEILRAQSRLEQAKAESALSRAESLPTLSLEAGGRYDLDHSKTGRLSDDPARFSIGLNLRGKLYQGGASMARRQAAGHAMASAEAAVRAGRVQISGALLQAQAQVGSLRRMMHMINSRDEMMRRTRDLYRRQYVELGTRSLLDLLNAEQELHQSAFDRINALHDLQLLGTDCLYNSGRLRARFGLDGAEVRGVELKP